MRADWQGTSPPLSTVSGLQSAAAGADGRSMAACGGGHTLLGVTRSAPHVSRRSIRELIYYRMRLTLELRQDRINWHPGYIRAVLPRTSIEHDLPSEANHARGAPFLPLPAASPRCVLAGQQIKRAQCTLCRCKRRRRRPADATCVQQPARGAVASSSSSGSAQPLPASHRGCPSQQP